jgi:hypothetical protein
VRAANMRQEHQRETVVGVYSAVVDEIVEMV